MKNMCKKADIKEGVGIREIDIPTRTKEIDIQIRTKEIDIQTRTREIDIQTRTKVIDIQIRTKEEDIREKIQVLGFQRITKEADILEKTREEILAKDNNILAEVTKMTEDKKTDTDHTNQKIIQLQWANRTIMSSPGTMYNWLPMSSETCRLASAPSGRGAMGSLLIRDITSRTTFSTSTMPRGWMKGSTCAKAWITEGASCLSTMPIYVLQVKICNI